MNTMKTITEHLLEEKKTAKFDEIWNEVQSNLMSEWTEKYNKKDTVITKVKIGELYTMLTTSGKFVKNQSDEWSLSKFYSYEEVQKMKINSGELED